MEVDAQVFGLIQELRLSNFFSKGKGVIINWERASKRFKHQAANQRVEKMACPKTFELSELQWNSSLLYCLMIIAGAGPENSRSVKGAKRPGSSRSSANWWEVPLSPKRCYARTTPGDARWDILREKRYQDIFR